MKNITIATLKKALSGKSEKELLSEITVLFKKFPQVKEYYTLLFSDDGHYVILEKYKQKIGNEFFPSRGYGKARLSIAKKAISDFKKISEDSSLLIDLMLFYVDQGVALTDTYGDIDYPFYISMEKMYQSALELAAKSNLLSHFENRSKKIVENACDGWGFKDRLSETFLDFYDKEIT